MQLIKQEMVRDEFHDKWLRSLCSHKREEDEFRGKEMSRLKKTAKIVRVLSS